VHEEGLEPAAEPEGRSERRSTPRAHAASGCVVHEEGLEPPHLAVPEPKSGASANSATRASGAEPSSGGANSPPTHAHPARRAGRPSRQRISPKIVRARAPRSSKRPAGSVFTARDPRQRHAPNTARPRWRALRHRGQSVPLGWLRLWGSNGKERKRERELDPPLRRVLRDRGFGRRAHVVGVLALEDLLRALLLVGVVDVDGD
jgi:hypothetical protein